MLLAAETNVEISWRRFPRASGPDLVIIDSIQTLWSDTADSAPGTGDSVCAGVQAMIRFAKQNGATMVMVGHVTIGRADCRTARVEHMVDACSILEGDRGPSLRILRTVKNRFGPTDEIGSVRNVGKGLREVANPSELFLR